MKLQAALVKGCRGKPAGSQRRWQAGVKLCHSLSLEPQGLHEKATNRWGANSPHVSNPPMNHAMTIGAV
jgi:hypothetical protein